MDMLHVFDVSGERHRYVGRVENIAVDGVEPIDLAIRDTGISGLLGIVAPEDAVPEGVPWEAIEPDFDAGLLVIDPDLIESPEERKLRQDSAGVSFELVEALTRILVPIAQANLAVLSAEEIQIVARLEQTLATSPVEGAADLDAALKARSRVLVLRYPTAES